MKKFLILCCALFTYNITACACEVPTFCGTCEFVNVTVDAPNCEVAAFYTTYQSVQVEVYSNFVRVKDGSDTDVNYSKNPYYNSKMCAPDWGWSTCYEYCFSYKGKTYFFNKC